MNIDFDKIHNSVTEPIQAKLNKKKDSGELMNSTDLMEIAKLSMVDVIIDCLKQYHEQANLTSAE